jgi:hypothetical protein
MNMMHLNWIAETMTTMVSSMNGEVNESGIDDVAMTMADSSDASDEMDDGDDDDDDCMSMMKAAEVTLYSVKKCGMDEVENTR